VAQGNDTSGCIPPGHGTFGCRRRVSPAHAFYLGSMYKSLRFLQNELCSALDRLPPSTAFNLLAYSKNVSRWRASSEPPTELAVKEAKTWIRALKVQSSTATVSALEAVFLDLDVRMIYRRTPPPPLNPSRSVGMRINTLQTPSLPSLDVVLSHSTKRTHRPLSQCC
jgi:hypothetical protein